MFAPEDFCHKRKGRDAGRLHGGGEKRQVYERESARHEMEGGKRWGAVESATLSLCL